MLGAGQANVISFPFIFPIYVHISPDGCVIGLLLETAVLPPATQMRTLLGVRVHKKSRTEKMSAFKR